MFKEFREFALRGNVVDMAVGIIIGAAFSGVVQSLVNDVVMPPIGLVTGQVDFTNLYFDLGGGTYASLQAARDAGAPVIAYGLFITTAVNFLVVAFAVFLLVRKINQLRRIMERTPEAVEVAPTTKNCPFCLSVIPIKATRCPQCTSQLAESS